METRIGAAGGSLASLGDVTVRCSRVFVGATRIREAVYDRSARTLHNGGMREKASSPSGVPRTLAGGPGRAEG